MTKETRQSSPQIRGTSMVHIERSKQPRHLNQNHINPVAQRHKFEALWYTPLHTSRLVIHRDKLTLSQSVNCHENLRIPGDTVGLMQISFNRKHSSFRVMSTKEKGREERPRPKPPGYCS